MTREFKQSISDGLRAGLRASEYANRDDVGLTECRGVVVDAGGLRAYEPVTQAISDAKLTAAGITPTWPFPQYQRLRRKTLLLMQTGIWEIDESDWTISAVTTYDPTAPATPKAIPGSGTLWHVADYEDSIYLFNDVCHVRYDKVLDKYLVYDDIGTGTGCNIDGRLVTAGFDSNEVWSAAWQTLFNGWITKAPTGFDETLSNASNLVFWTNVGDASLFDWLQDSTTAIVGDLNTHTTDNPLVHELYMRNDWGFANCEFQGKVLTVLPLANGFIAFGEDGVCGFKSFVEPEPTFGQIKLADTGIAERDAWAGDRYTGYMYIDTEGALWKISPDFQTQRMNYREYFEAAAFGVSDLIAGAYDATRGFAYLSDGSISYLISTHGVSEITESISGSFYSGGTLYAHPFANTDTDFFLETETLTESYGGLKRLFAAVLIGNIVEESSPASVINLRARYRYNTNDSWANTTYIPLSVDGFAIIESSAKEHRIQLQAGEITDLQLEQLDVLWTNVDNRFMRGSNGSSRSNSNRR